MHFRDPQFGAVVLAVCALASRYSDDPRVFIEGTNSEHSSGWKWYRQVRPFRATFSPLPSLYQLQLICVRRILVSSSSAQVHLAERNVYGWHPRFGGELDPRIYWAPFRARCWSSSSQWVQEYGASKGRAVQTRLLGPLYCGYSHELVRPALRLGAALSSSTRRFRGRPCITQPAE
jgi:hypothetical protein